MVPDCPTTKWSSDSIDIRAEQVPLPPPPDLPVDEEGPTNTKETRRRMQRAPTHMYPPPHMTHVSSSSSLEGGCRERPQTQIHNGHVHRRLVVVERERKRERSEVGVGLSAGGGGEEEEAAAVFF